MSKSIKTGILLLSSIILSGCDSEGLTKLVPVSSAAPSGSILCGRTGGEGAVNGLVAGAALNGENPLVAAESVSIIDAPVSKLGLLDTICYPA